MDFALVTLLNQVSVKRSPLINILNFPISQKLEIRRSISVTSVIDRPVRTCDILWLSTHQFAAAYIAKDSENENFNQPNLFLAQLPAKDEKKDVVWRNYEDPCYGQWISRPFH